MRVLETRMGWFHDRHPLVITYKWARRIAIAIIGFTVLITGVLMLVLPGPAFIVIPAGLGILSLEFAWARHWLHRVREQGDVVIRTFWRRGRNGGKGAG